MPTDPSSADPCTVQGEGNPVVNPADVELVALWFSRWFGASSVRSRDRAYARDVLSALAAAGRLVPDTDTEWAVRFSDGSVSTGLWTTEKSARLRAAEYGYPDAEPVRRAVGPWLPVPNPTEETPDE